MFYIVFVIGLLLSLSVQKKLTAKLYAAIITTVAIFRYGCGADYFSYQFLYNRIQPSFILEYTDPLDKQELGFRLIGSILKQLNLSYQIYLAIFAIVSIYFVYKIAIKYSKNPTLTLVVYYACYYFFWTYSSLRQGTAMVIGIYYFLEAINGQKIKKFIIITLLLTLIHSSAVFLIGLYILSKIKFKKSHLIVLSVLGIMISMLPLGGIILGLSKYIPILSRVAYYVEASYAFNNIFDFQTIGRLLFLLIAFIFYDSYTKEHPENKKIINMYIISFVLYFTLKFSEMTAARLAVYGKMLDIIILPNIIYLIKLRWNRNLYVAFLVMLLFVYMFKDLKYMEVYAGLVNNTAFLTPYTNIFNKENFVFYSQYLEIN